MIQVTKPLYVVWEVTSLCNLECKHCYSNASLRSPGELTTQEAKRMIDQLAELGTLFLALSGGEPLLRPDWEEVSLYAHQKGLLVGIGTSGWVLDRRMAERIRSAGVSRCTVSIDGVSAEVHERVRPKAGSFARAVAAVGHLKHAGVRTVVGYTPTVFNLEDSRSIIDFAESLGADAVNLFEFVPTGRGNCQISPTSQELKEIIEYWAREKKRRTSGFDIFWHDCRVGEFLAPEEKAKYTGCGAGRVLCRIMVDGKVAPCVTLPMVAGDLRKDTLKDIWENSDVMVKIRDRSNIMGNCARCSLLYSCGGCRAMAKAWTGDPFNGDPMCWITPPDGREVLTIV